MKTWSKIILAVGVAVMVFAVLSFSILLYYYTHPPKVKSLVEKFVSGSIGASFSIQRMTYSRNPLKVGLEGVHVGPGPEMRGFSLDVPAAAAEFSFEGPGGQRTLVVRNIQIAGFTSQISEKPELPGIKDKPVRTSFLGDFLKRLFAFFVFRNVRFQSAIIHEGLVSAHLGKRTFQVEHLRANLKAGRPFEFFCGMRVEWPSRGLNVSLPHVYVKADQKLSLDDLEIGGFLSLKGADFESPMGGIRDLEAKTRLRYQVKKRILSFSSTELVPGRIDFKKGARAMVLPPGMRIATGGEVRFGSETLRADPLRITLGDRLRFEGAFDAGFGLQVWVLVKIVKSSFFPDRLRSLLPPGIKMPPVKLIGPVNLTGSIQGLRPRNGESAWTWKGDLQTSFQQNHLSFVSSGIRGNGNIAGVVRSEGTFPDIEVSGSLKAKDILLSGTGLDVSPFVASFSFSGTYPNYGIMNLSARIPEVKRVFQGRELVVRDLSLKALEGKADAKKRTLYLPAVRLDSSLLKNFEASLDLGPKDGVMKIRGSETTLLEALASLKLLPSGWKASGLDRVEVAARLKRDGGYALNAQVAFEGFSFQNREKTCLGEALAVKAELEGKISSSFSRIEAQTRLRADKGEILYDRFYFDLKKNPFACSGKGFVNASKGQYRLAGLRLGLKSILQLHLDGELGGSGAARSFDVSVKIPDTPLAPVFKTLVRDPFQTEKPIFGTMDADGSLSGDITLKGIGSQWSGKGRLFWNEGGLSIGSDKASLEGIELSLPFWYRNYNKKDPSKPLKGKLSVRAMKIPLLPAQPLDLTLLAGPNTFSIPAPILLEVPGGKVRVGPLITTGWADMRPSCDTSLNTDSLNLGPLLGKLFTQGVAGTLNGSLDSIHIEKGIMNGKGRMEAKVFGGSVVLSNIGASGLITSTPVFKLDARLHDLDLAQLTASTGFGKIQGVLTGYVNSLEIAGGQPQRFDLLLETVKKKGIPQRISVKAVDHIAELGGGQSPFIGAAGIFASLFKEFPYRKIGVHATLENDVFRINGTIKDGGKEYLVKRSLISGVNVINQNPDNRVSFKDMVKRLKRVTTSKTSPVVK